MNRTRLLAISPLLALCVVLALLIAGAAGAAMVRVGTLVLRADGGFAPHVLPRHRYAPIRFQGHAEIGTTDSTQPPALRHVLLYFDRDGRLTTAGLPVCQPASIEGTSPKEARQRCRGAIVGRGHVAASVALPGAGAVTVRSALTLFNGPREGGNATVIAHAHTDFPTAETYVVVVPIEARHGAYSYRTSFSVPELAGGYGALTHVDLKIGRRYTFRGARRSYTSARCSDGILETRGSFSFSDGTVVSGNVFRVCRARG